MNPPSLKLRRVAEGVRLELTTAINRYLFSRQAPHPAGYPLCIVIQNLSGERRNRTFIPKSGTCLSRTAQRTNVCLLSKDVSLAESAVKCCPGKSRTCTSRFVASCPDPLDDRAIIKRVMHEARTHKHKIHNLAAKPVCVTSPYVTRRSFSEGGCSPALEFCERCSPMLKFASNARLR